ncbi:hypothetical protein [Actinoplanes sp. NPDC020271]|uniref:hypothetical protein n=1 Tax=Actinoplanes sp. NPDC020271 TaxID=3363896 RepID=UPI003788E474
MTHGQATYTESNHRIGGAHWPQQKRTSHRITNGWNALVLRTGDRTTEEASAVLRNTDVVGGAPCVAADLVATHPSLVAHGTTQQRYQL